MPKLGSVNQMLPSRAQTMSLGEFRRSEEHTSELQSQSNLVCRLLLEKKKPDSGHHHRLAREAESAHAARCAAAHTLRQASPDDVRYRVNTDSGYSPDFSHDDPLGRGR